MKCGINAFCTLTLATDTSLSVNVSKTASLTSARGIQDFKLSPCPECCMLFWGDSPASEFYMPTFRNTLFHLRRQVGVKNFPGV